MTSPAISVHPVHHTELTASEREPCSILNSLWAAVGCLSRTKMARRRVQKPLILPRYHCAPHLAQLTHIYKRAKEIIMAVLQARKQPLLLITYPRSASNLLVKILSLPEQQQAVLRETGSYLFFPAAASVNQTGLLHRPQAEWSEDACAGLHSAPNV